MNKKEKNRRLKYGALATVITVLGVLAGAGGEPGDGQAVGKIRVER